MIKSSAFNSLTSIFLGMCINENEKKKMCPGPPQAVGPVGPWPYPFLAPNILHEVTHVRTFVGSFINSKACMGMRLTRLHLHLVPRWGKTTWLAATPASLDSSRER